MLKFCNFCAVGPGSQAAEEKRLRAIAEHVGEEEERLEAIVDDHRVAEISVHVEEHEADRLWAISAEHEAKEEPEPVAD
jgi:hypothetical protein